MILGKAVQRSEASTTPAIFVLPNEVFCNIFDVLLALPVEFKCFQFTCRRLYTLGSKVATATADADSDNNMGAAVSSVSGQHVPKLKLTSEQQLELQVRQLYDHNIRFPFKKRRICGQCKTIKSTSQFPEASLRINGWHICRDCMFTRLMESAKPGETVHYKNKEANICARCKNLRLDNNRKSKEEYTRLDLIRKKMYRMWFGNCSNGRQTAVGEIGDMCYVKNYHSPSEIDLKCE